MIEQIKTFKGNALAIEVIDGFTKTDEKLVEKLFAKKIDEGNEQVNVLVKLDEIKMNHINTKAFMKNVIWVLRNYKHIGHLAIVAHSKIVKALVPIDNFVFERLQKGYEERYFDVSQLDKAFEFINTDK
ncbi:MAG: STAS/SEC14 domain-containing protein [Cyclobacteriaceae bacterium]|nr:STAS/SEC14 domain-containing protein [Cyclobacteriaceae bacterium]MCB0498355.1 STAS/SEC14 domain-containing protein [Cyclobacteriaceae bacterium]MCB9239079.1 STAS/SEC14 domain-containing protein [Flammeovirgaceae bacterium]MCO5271105.1 STAS/SEC14 domain-containing protein [Cyclobacteriaceae bacterium]MCW5903459.1 STAS/SEC14 domain-containing protein [Cyclobacteriaceae bacterium]